MSISTTELMNRGMRCLVEKLGTVEAEMFIATILRERFDYTQWQHEHFADVELETFNAAAAHWEKEQGEALGLK